MAQGQKKPPRLIDITQYGIPDIMKTFMIECPNCHHQWVINIVGKGFALEESFTCKKCQTVAVDLKES